MLKNVRPLASYLIDHLSQLNKIGNKGKLKSNIILWTPMQGHTRKFAIKSNDR